MSTVDLLLALSIVSLAHSKLSINEQCIRFKHLYGQIPIVIEAAASDICDTPSTTLQCNLMGRLAVEYSRERVMELRSRSKCFQLDSSEYLTNLEKCAILEELPLQSVKLATKIFAKSPEKHVAKIFALAVANAINKLTDPIYVNIGCGRAQ